MFVKKLIVRLAFTILIVGIFSAVAVLAAPGINKQLSYQGTLKTSGGVNVTDGNFDMVFKIYDAVTGGNLLWTGTHTAANGNAVTVTNGIFNVLLGSGTGNTMTLDFNTDTLYLGITVSTDSEMTPRQRIGAAAYAFNADTVDGTGFATTTFSTGDVLYYDGSAFQRLSKSNDGLVLKLSGGIPSWSADIQGPSQANIFATTTDDLVIYPVDTSDVLVIGSNATTTTGNIFEVVGSSLFGGNGIFTGLLTAYNTISAPLFNATSTTATSTFTNLSVSANSELGTVIGGTWQGSTIGEIYGGTGQSSYVIGDILYADAANSLARLATSTKGSVLQLSFSTGLPSYVATSTLGITLSDTTGTLAVNRGGTGSTTPTDFLFGDGAGGLTSTSTIAQNFIDPALARTANVLTLTNWFATTSAFHLSTLEGVTSFIATNATTTNATSTNLAVSGTTALMNTTNSGILTVTGLTTLGNASTTQLSVSSNFYTALTANSVPFVGTNGLLTEDTSNLVFDDTNNRLGIGTTSPYELLSVAGNGVFTGSLDVQSTSATSTFAAGLQATALNITSTSATSTFGNGITLSAGCFRDASGSCVTGSVDSGTQGQLPFYNAAGTDLTATSTLFLTQAGNVGIGTTSPSAQLALSNLLYVGGTGTSTIENNLAVLGGLQVGNSSLYIDNNSIQNLSGALFLQPTGSNFNALVIGAGATSTLAQFEVHSGVGSTTPIATFANTESTFSLFGTNASPEGLITAATGTLAIDSTNGKLYIKGDSGDATGWTDVAGQGAFITGSGTTTLSTLSDNVGIGTTSPAFLLDLYATTTRNLFRIGTSTADSILTLNSNGSLGLGTSTPAFDTSGSFSLSNLLYVGGTGTSTIENNLEVLGALKIGNSSLYLDNDSIENLSGSLTFQSSLGRFGIGTTSPAYVLDVYATTTDNLFRVGTSTSPNILVLNSTGNFGLGTSTPGANLVISGTTGQNLFQIATSTNQNILVVDNDGFLGLGTANPSSILHLSSSAASTTPILTLGNTEGSFQFFTTNASPEGAITAATGTLAIDSTNGKLYIKGDAGDNTSWTDVAAGTFAVQHISGAITLAVNTKYYASTTASAFTVTLPTGSADGDRIQVLDATGNFAANNLSVLPGGTDTIEGSTSTTTLSTSNTVTTFIYDKTALRWTIQGDNEETSTTLAPLTIVHSAAYSNTTGSPDHTDGKSFTVTQAGKYLFDFRATGFVSTASMTMTFEVRNGATVLGSDSETSLNNNVHVEYSGMVEVDLAVGTTYNVRVTTTGSRDANDFTRIYHKQLPSAVITAQAQASEYILITPVDGDSMSGTGDDLDLGTVQKSSGISADMTANTISLKAGKTYELIAELRPFSISGTLEYGWVDSSNTELITSVGRGLSAESANESPNAGARIIYTPTVDTDVKVRSVNGTGSFSVESRISRIEVRVIADGTFVKQFTGATASAAGTTGFIPAPSAGQQNALLLGNGSWLATTSLQFDTSIGSLNIGLGTSATSTLSNALFTVGSTTASQILYVGQDGNVGIGTTSPTALLGLQGAIGVNSTQLYLAADGKVGIGTTSPARSLHISSNSFAEIQLTSDAETTARDWHLSVDETNGRFSIVETDVAEQLTILEGGNVGIGTTTPGAALNVIGALCVDDTTPTCGDASRTDGTIYAVATAISGIDLAEQYPTKDDTLIAGELIALDPLNPTFVKRAQGEEDEQLIGIVSTAPGVLLGGFGSEQFVNEAKVAVALSGRTPVNVTTENGDIDIGDRITISSVAGVGMKATAAYRSVGYALEPYSGDGIGEIKVFVQLEPGIIVSDAPFEGTVVVQDYTFEGSVIVRGHATFNEDTVGQAKILAGDTLVRITFSEEYQYQPIVTITPRENWNGNYWVSDESTAGFVINVDPTQTANVTFNWHAFGVDGGKIYVSDGTVENIEITVANGTSASPEATQDESGDSEPPVMDSTSSPQVTINGNNPAEIPVGATYSDNGITIEDDVDQNLGYSITLDGVEVTQIQIDTSEPGTHTIIYSVTDNDGNTTTATREVIVGGGDQNLELEPAPEPTPTEEPVIESPVEETAVEEVVEEVVVPTIEEVGAPTRLADSPRFAGGAGATAERAESVGEEPVVEEPSSSESPEGDITPIGAEVEPVPEPVIEEPIVEEPAADTNLAPQPTNE